MHGWSRSYTYPYTYSEALIKDSMLPSGAARKTWKHCGLRRDHTGRINPRTGEGGYPRNFAVKGKRDYREENSERREPCRRRKRGIYIII